MEAETSGLPWGVANAIGGVVVAAFIGLWRWSTSHLASAKAELAQARREEVERLEALRAKKDAQIEEAERRLDAIEKDYRAHLDRDIDLFMAAERGTPVPVPRDRPGTLEQKKITARIKSECLSPEVVAAARRLIDSGQMP